MAYDHPLPTTLIPPTNICVPIYIPDDPDYIENFLGALRVLEGVGYWLPSAGWDLADSEVVVAQWRTRTITPLIEALAAGTPCGAAGGCMIGAIKIRRGTDLAVSAGTTAIDFAAPGSISESFQHEISAWSAVNPTRIENTSLDSWFGWAHGQVTFDSDGALGTRNPKIAKNGTEIALFHTSNSGASRSFACGTFVELEPGEYIEFQVTVSSSVTLEAGLGSMTFGLAVLGVV